MKLWKKIVIGIGVIVIIFIVLTIRKFMIFTNLDYKNKEQQKSGNIYCKVTREQQVSELYIKGNTHKMVAKRDNVVVTQLTKPEYRIMYIDNGKEKIMKVYYEDNLIMDSSFNFCDYYSVPEKILNCIVSKINTEKIDGQEYYVISGTYNIPKGIKVYINKNTGLTYKRVETIKENGNLRDVDEMFEYKFNVVTDEDVAELDSSEYKIED